MYSPDANGRLMVAAGTIVTVRTKNGGEATLPLARNHYPTYDVCFAEYTIPSFRIASLTVDGVEAWPCIAGITAGPPVRNRARLSSSMPHRAHAAGR